MPFLLQITGRREENGDADDDDDDVEVDVDEAMV
jgi:hypothetical protein